LESLPSRGHVGAYFAVATCLYRFITPRPD
jgi:hypothetical protein